MSLASCSTSGRVRQAGFWTSPGAPRQRLSASLRPPATTHKSVLTGGGRPLGLHGASISAPSPAHTCSALKGVASAPSISDDDGGDGQKAKSGSKGGPPSGGPQPNQAKVLFKRVTRSLANLQLAISELVALASFSALGTFIEQDKPYDFYIDSFPEDHKLLGLLDYNAIFLLQLDHIYSSWWFLSLLILFGASLAACTSTTQIPMVKVANRWKYISTPKGVLNQPADKGMAETLPNARLMDLGRLLADAKYQVFRDGDRMYAFKGLAGRIGPIGVHASMLATLFGITLGSVAGFKGTVMLPQNDVFLVANELQASSQLALMPAGGRNAIRLNNFTIDYRADGSIAQYFSDLSAVDVYTQKEVLRKTISVNDPFRIGGVTMYQTDWSITALQVLVKGGQYGENGLALQIPMSSLEGTPGTAGKLYAAYLPTGAPAAEDGKNPPGISFLARDLQTITLYDTAGQFAGVRRPESGKTITVDGLELTVLGMLGGSGLELKADPGVPLVYAGFGGMMLATLLAYQSHSQVWAVQEGSTVHVGGRSNRAILEFEGEMDKILEAVPEVEPSGPEETPPPPAPPVASS